MHEIAHTLQPQAEGAAATGFSIDDSAAEQQARSIADAFASGAMPLRTATPLATRCGVARERDPRLDDLVQVVESLPRVLTEEAVAEELDRAVPGLDLSDPDNVEPLNQLLEESWSPGSVQVILDHWRALQAGVEGPAAEASRGGSAAPRGAEREAAQAQVEAEAPTAALASPRSMSGSDIRAQIDSLRTELGMPPLDEAAPRTESVVPQGGTDQHEVDRLEALEAEYYRRRGLLEAAREFSSGEAARQRSGGAESDVMRLAQTAVTNPAMLGTETVATVLGHPAEDFATGFLPGFLAGAELELPADAFERLAAETRAHPILFNGGVIAGAPVGAAQGLWDMLVGLAELLGLMMEYSPAGQAWHGMRDIYRMVTDPEGYQAEQRDRWQQARTVGEAIVSLVTSLLGDRAFMVSHGQELGEIAGRAAANWFSSDFMSRSTFDKGFLVGRVEGRVIFEVVALCIGPEEWVARGVSAAGEVARLSAPLRRAILEAIERIPALARLLRAGRGATTVARESVVAERVAGEGAELLGEVGRGGRAAEAGSRAPETAVEAERGTSAVTSGGEAAPTAQAGTAASPGVEVPPESAPPAVTPAVRSAPVAAPAPAAQAVAPAGTAEASAAPATSAVPPVVAAPAAAPGPAPGALGGDLAARVDRAIRMAPRSAPYRQDLLALREQIRRAQHVMADRRRRITADAVDAVEAEFNRLVDDVAADSEVAGDRAVAEVLRGGARGTTSSDIGQVMSEASGGTSSGLAVDPRGAGSRGVDEGMPEATTDPTARQAGRAARRALRGSTGAAPGGWQLHHLVPWELREHPAVYEYERLIEGIDNPRATASIGERWINQPTNALPMPSDPAVAGAEGLTIHRGSHPRYTAWMENHLDELWSQYRGSGDMSVEEFGRRFEAIVGEGEVMLASGHWGPRVN